MSGRENSKSSPWPAGPFQRLALNQQSAGVARVRGKLEEGERTGTDCLYLTPPPETRERGEKSGGGGTRCGGVPAAGQGGGAKGWGPPYSWGGGESPGILPSRGDKVDLTTRCKLCEVPKRSCGKRLVRRGAGGSCHSSRSRGWGEHRVATNGTEVASLLG